MSTPDRVLARLVVGALTAVVVVVLASVVAGLLAGGPDEVGAAPLAGLVWVLYLAYGGFPVMVPLLLVGLAVLRRCGSGPLPRVLVGAVAGAVVGCSSVWTLTAVPPWSWDTLDAGVFVGLLLFPALAGAVGGLVADTVRPRRRRRPSDEQVEDALLDGVRP